MTIPKHASIKVYVAAPFAGAPQAANVRAAIKLGAWLIGRGYCPYIPQLNHLCDLVCGAGPTAWRSVDLEWLKQCDVVLYAEKDCPGPSQSVQEELDEARRNGIPIFLDKFELDKQVPPDMAPGDLQIYAKMMNVCKSVDPIIEPPAANNTCADRDSAAADAAADAFYELITAPLYEAYHRRRRNPNPPPSANNDIGRGVPY